MWPCGMASHKGRTILETNRRLGTDFLDGMAVPRRGPAPRPATDRFMDSHRRAIVHVPHSWLCTRLHRRSGARRPKAAARRGRRLPDLEDVISGKTFTRPGLTSLLDHLRPGDTLAVVRLDRLGRSLRELLEVVETLKQRGVALLSLEEKLDTSSAAGELVFHVFGAIAQFERRLIAERTRDGIANARAKGRRPGRPPLAGQAGRRAPAGAEWDIADAGGPAGRPGAVHALSGTPGARACVILTQRRGSSPRRGPPEGSTGYPTAWQHVTGGNTWADPLPRPAGCASPAEEWPQTPREHLS